MSLPKVLILNQPFVSNTGGGITLSNLFSRWDSEKLAVACSGYLLNTSIDPQICNNYYQLGQEERQWIFPLNLFTRRYPSGPVYFDKKAKQDVLVKTSKSRAKVSMDYLLPVLQFTGISNIMTRTGLSSRFCTWLDEYGPELIYSQSSSLESILFCLSVKEYLKIPMVFHMMDDWPALIGRQGILGKYWQRKIDTELKRLIDWSDSLMAISDYMAEVYKVRYDKDFLVFHNPIDVDFWKSGQRKEYTLNKNPTILYAGRVGLGIDTSLQNIASAVAVVNNELGLPLKFVIQAQEAPSWINEHEFVEYRSFAAYDQLPEIFGSADFLILPYDFSDKAIDYIKYSMPTKASEYMASGTPILIFAPEETALARYAKEKSWAAVVTENSHVILAKSLIKMIENKSLRSQIANRAKTIAESYHALEIVTKDFKNALIQTSQNGLKDY